MCEATVLPHWVHLLSCGATSGGMPCACAAASSRFCVLELPYERDQESRKSRKDNRAEVIGLGVLRFTGDLSRLKPELFNFNFNLSSALQSGFRAFSDSSSDFGAHRLVLRRFADPPAVPIAMRIGRKIKQDILPDEGRQVDRLGSGEFQVQSEIAARWMV